MKKHINNLSIRMTIFILFKILMLTTVILISYIVFSNWLTSVDETITEIAEETNKEIHAMIETFMDVPIHINEINRLMIENEIVDLQDQEQREKFFVGVMQSHASQAVYSFSYGNEQGEYYGARRNNEGIIEIMRNNSETGGHSWYYAVTDQLTADERVVEAGKFDARTRDWYTAAKESQTHVISPIYKHFVLDDLTVSASVPIYNKQGEFQGVLGSHINLSRIDQYLNNIVQQKDISAIIIEKDTGKLISNTLGITNFRQQSDGTITRTTIQDIDNPVIIQAYQKYLNNQDTSMKLEGSSQNKYINITEYHNIGANWVAITALPENPLISNVMDNLYLAIILTTIAVILSIIIYFTISGKLLSPIGNLLEATEKFSQGYLTQRATISRNDEIGRLSKSFNMMADTISNLITNLEFLVKERTQELQQANIILKDNKEQLQLILNSTAEAIYGMDLEGNCTFCNTSCLKVLGYDNHDELIGKNMHEQIHHTHKNGEPMPLSECKIINALKIGQGTHADDEVFWRKDGTSFDVEYRSYPQLKEGKVVGAVVTFMDNTERKKHQEHIEYISYHDSLTGLYNRTYFEEQVKNIDTEDNLPISIIFGDVNGLKLTNDIFGHWAGDDLLKKSAEILKKACRKNDIVARVGGDEFAILLPKTDSKQGERIITRIKDELSKATTTAIKASISMGHQTKTKTTQKLNRLIENAENIMYKEKMHNRKKTDSELANTIINTLHEKSPTEKQHSINVSQICQKIGEAMGMPETEVRKLKQAGYLHDIGKIILEDNMLNKEDTLNNEETIEMQQHPVIGYRILNLFDETLDLAEGVLNHHENWDGSGYPKGIQGEEIPLLARIIKVAEDYDAKTNTLKKSPQTQQQALTQIQQQSGKTYDPKIVKILTKILTTK